MDPALLITAYIIFVYSTVCHEAAHAWVAKKLGDNTAYLGGQVTLDPIPHIKREPIGMVVVPLLFLVTSGRLFGWASAPIDPMWASRHPQRSAVVALAGPAANFILCIIAFLTMFIGAKNGVFVPPANVSIFDIVAGQQGTAWATVAHVLSTLFSLNLLLGILNLMPIPPLDGSNIPLLFLKERAADAYQQTIRQPWVSLMGLVVLIKFFPAIYGPAFTWTVVKCYQWFFGPF